DIELEQSDKSAAQFGRREFCNVDRAQDRRSPDPEAANESENKEGAPAPCEGAACSRDHIKYSGEPQGLTAAEALSDLPRPQRTDHSAHQSNSDCEPFFVGVKIVELDERADRTGDHDGVEAKKQASESARKGRPHQVHIESHVLVCSSVTRTSYRDKRPAANFGKATEMEGLPPRHRQFRHSDQTSAEF